MNHAWMSEDDDLSGCLVCGALYAEDRIAAEVLRCSGRTDLCHGDPHDGGALGSMSADAAVGCDCALCWG